MTVDLTNRSSRKVRHGAKCEPYINININSFYRDKANINLSQVFYNDVANTAHPHIYTQLPDMVGALLSSIAFPLWPE